MGVRPPNVWKIFLGSHKQHSYKYSRQWSRLHSSHPIFSILSNKTINMPWLSHSSHLTPPQEENHAILHMKMIMGVRFMYAYLYTCCTSHEIHDYEQHLLYPLKTFQVFMTSFPRTSSIVVQYFTSKVVWLIICTCVSLFLFIFNSQC